jgi:hypothetical protein
MKNDTAPKDCEINKNKDSDNKINIKLNIKSEVINNNLINNKNESHTVIYFILWNEKETLNDINGENEVNLKSALIYYQNILDEKNDEIKLLKNEIFELKALMKTPLSKTGENNENNKKSNTINKILSNSMSNEIKFNFQNNIKEGTDLDDKNFFSERNSNNNSMNKDKNGMTSLHSSLIHNLISGSIKNFESLKHKKPNTTYSNLFRKSNNVNGFATSKTYIHSSYPDKELIELCKYIILYIIT